MDEWEIETKEKSKTGKDEEKKKKDPLSSICELLDATRLHWLAHSVKHVCISFIQVHATKYFTQIV